MFVHRRVLWPSNFMIFIMWWTEELYSQHPSQIGDQGTYKDPRNQLVPYWELCIEMRDCHYKTSPIGYSGKGSTVGWYKVLWFFYLELLVLIIVDSWEWWPYNHPVGFLSCRFSPFVYKSLCQFNFRCIFSLIDDLFMLLCTLHVNLIN